MLNLFEEDDRGNTMGQSTKKTQAEWEISEEDMSLENRLVNNSHFIAKESIFITGTYIFMPPNFLLC